MLVLSFRDMAVDRRGGVTVATLYDMGALTPAEVWSPPPGYGKVLADPSTAGLAGHVCFLIHGFNVDRDDGYTGLGVMAQEFSGAGPLPNAARPLDLRIRNVDVIVPVLWAGDWYLPINYPFLLPDIRLTARYFANFILELPRAVRRVSFVTHSMGARVALETVRATLAGRGQQPAPAFDTAILTAGAVADDIMDQSDFTDTVNAFSRFVVVSSMDDTVLSGAFPAGNWVEQLLWLDDPGRDEALGRYGPRLKAGSPALPKTAWYPLTGGYNHGDYIPSPDKLALVPNGWSDKTRLVAQVVEQTFVGPGVTVVQASPIQPV
jgi:hypothetical protein